MYKVGQLLDQNLLVLGFSSREEETAIFSNASRQDFLLFLWSHGFEFSTSEAAVGDFTFTDDVDLLSDRLGSFLDITSDHDDTNTSFSAALNGISNLFNKKNTNKLYFRSRRVLDTNNTEDSWFTFKLAISFNVGEESMGRVVGAVVVRKGASVVFISNSQGSKSSLGHEIDSFQEILLGIIVKGNNISIREHNILSTLDQIIRCTLDEHDVLSSLLVFAKDGHALSVTTEFEGSEFLISLSKVSTISFSEASIESDLVISGEFLNKDLKGGFSGQSRSSDFAFGLDELSIVVQTHTFNKESEGF